ncbi:MAG: sigma-70 family RNA polymerase sigma factor [Bacillota bacterium]
MRSDITSVFNQVYDETYDDVMRFVLSRTGDCEAAGDILQEIYKALFVRFRNKGADDIEDYKGYLIVSASNVIKKHYAYLKVQKATVVFNSVSNEDNDDNQALEALEFELSAEIMGIEESVEISDMAERVLEYLEKKSETVKKLFVLHFFGGLTIKEAALNIGISQSQAVNHIYRTIQELKSKFELEGLS